MGGGKAFRFCLGSDEIMAFPPRPLHPKVKRKKKKNQVVVKYCIVIVGICIKKSFTNDTKRRWRGMREIERDRERAPSEIF